jgi:hypothetical protein
MKNQDIHPLDIRLSPHQTRLVVERNSLATRLKDLQKFIAVSPEFPLLPHDERNLMLDQRDTMGRYLLILNQRIERIERIDLPAKAGNKTETPAPQPEPVMGPRLKDVTKECGCFYCRLSRQIQKEDEQREKAWAETQAQPDPGKDVGLCDCPPTARQCALLVRELTRVLDLIENQTND